MPRKHITGSKSTSTFVLNHRIRWTSAVNNTPRPLYRRGRTPVAVFFRFIIPVVFYANVGGRIRQNRRFVFYWLDDDYMFRPCLAIFRS